MPRTSLIFALLLALPTAAAAQTGPIRAGMSEAEVRSAFGAPALTRTSGEWSYLFYRNACTPRCGSDDVVFLRDGAVVTAVLRTPARRFSGPAASPALARQG
ncbi:MAG: outer membrane protein assembly factor BamE, partial [Gemmatimonadota bacterium]|nr:outer membrane protein assembly factor BamE [Gemmatimonadota bacterium]